jgi:hypothetical protein
MLVLLLLFSHSSFAERFDHGRIAMIKETTGFGIQQSYGGHIFRIERKIYAVEILLHAFLANCLGNSNDASLRQPTG